MKKNCYKVRIHGEMFVMADDDEDAALVASAYLSDDPPLDIEPVRLEIMVGMHGSHTHEHLGIWRELHPHGQSALDHRTVGAIVDAIYKKAQAPIKRYLKKKKARGQ